MLVLGSLAAVPSIIVATLEGMPLIAVVDVLALATVAALRFLPSIGHRLRTLCLLGLIYALGVWFLFRVGWVSHLYLVAVPVLAAVLLGLRAAIVALTVDTVTLLVVGVGFGVGPYLDAAGTHISPGMDAPTAGWLIVTINFAFVAAALSVSCALLFERFERSYVEQQRVSDSLVAQRLHLHRTNDSLVHEISERKRIEADLSRVATAVDQAREVILIATPSGRIVYRNAAGHELARRLGGPAHLERLADLGTQAPGEPAGDWVGSVTVPSGSGTGFQYELTMATVRSGAGRVQNTIAVLRDVTVERQLEDRAQRAERLEALGTLASGVAHDFNNVIASVLGTAEWIRAQEPVGDDLDEACDTIIAACDRAAGIVREMMVLGRRSQPARTAISLGEVLTGSLPVLRGLLPAQVELRETVHGDVTVLATRTEIDRVLTNLVANARDSIGESIGVISIVLDMVDDGAIGRQIERRMPTGLRHGRRYARLSVSDTGRGIDAANVARIFDPFFTTRQSDGGTGLGLAGVNAIVTGLGGEIDVFSEIGFGAAFVVHLPAVDESTSVDASISSPSLDATGDDDAGGIGNDTRIDPGEGAPLQPSEPEGQNATILLVDDDEPLLAVITRALRRAGFTVVPVIGALEALDAFEQSPDAIDLLVSDLTMPNMSGTELLRELRDRRVAIPAVLMSGLGEADVEADPMRDEIAAFLHKPFSVVDLVDVVRRALPIPAPGDR